MTTIKTAKQWAKEIWNDEHRQITLDAVPESMRREAASELDNIRSRNAELCRGLEGDYHAICATETADAASERGETTISLLPLDVGFDVRETKHGVNLPECSGVLTVLIPAGRLDASWQRDYSHAVSTRGNVTTIRSQHASLVREMLRMAGYKVSR